MKWNQIKSWGVNCTYTNQQINLQVFLCVYIFQRFAKSVYLSRYVNVIHVTINIPFNDKSVPEKELLLASIQAKLYQSPSCINISASLHRQYQLLENTHLIFPRALISAWLSCGRFNWRRTSRQFSSLNHLAWSELLSFNPL